MWSAFCPWSVCGAKSTKSEKKKEASWKIDKGKKKREKRRGPSRTKCSLWALQNSAGARGWTVEKGDRKRSRVTSLYTVTRREGELGGSSGGLDTHSLY